MTRSSKGSIQKGTTRRKRILHKQATISMVFVSLSAQLLVRVCALVCLGGQGLLLFSVHQHIYGRYKGKKNKPHVTGKRDQVASLAFFAGECRHVVWESRARDIRSHNASANPLLRHI